MELTSLSFCFGADIFSHPGNIFNDWQHASADAVVHLRKDHVELILLCDHAVVFNVSVEVVTVILNLLVR